MAQRKQDSGKLEPLETLRKRLELRPCGSVKCKSSRHSKAGSWDKRGTGWMDGEESGLAEQGDVLKNGG